MALMLDFQENFSTEYIPLAKERSSGSKDVMSLIEKLPRRMKTIRNIPGCVYHISMTDAVRVKHSCLSDASLVTVAGVYNFFSSPSRVFDRIGIRLSAACHPSSGVVSVVGISIDGDIFLLVREGSLRA